MKIRLAALISMLVLLMLGLRTDAALSDHTTPALPATARVSITNLDGEGFQDSESTHTAIDLTGQRVAFHSAANYVVGGSPTQLDDTNGHEDIYVRDYSDYPGNQDQRTIRISVNDNETSGGNEPSYFPSVSPFGRFVVFQSLSNNLIVGTDNNNRTDIFLRDRDPNVDGNYDESSNLGATVRVSVADNEDQANGSSSEAVVSHNADYVAFESVATNLVSDDTGGFQDIFVRDRSGVNPGNTFLISRHTCGAVGNAGSSSPSLDFDGLYATFVSAATNLTGTNSGCDADCDAGCEPAGINDVFLRDRSASTTSRVSVAYNGAAGNGDSSGPTPVSWGGRFVAFRSVATNLVPGDTNGLADIFVRDTCQGTSGCTPTTTRMNLASDESQATGAADQPSMSRDGRYVAFFSTATDLVSDDTNALGDVFIRDRDPDADLVFDEANAYTVRASLTAAGAQGTGGVSLQPSLSAGAGVLAFESDATNLVSGDTNGDKDIFLRESNSDGDSILDPFDNCPTIANNPSGDDPPNDVQLDTDGDGQGNACDTDDDSDTFTDTMETTYGSDPLNAASTPEGPAADAALSRNTCNGFDDDLNEGIDEGFTNTDGDSQANCVDADDDNDGFPDAAELASAGVPAGNVVGSDPLNAASRPEVCDGSDNDLNEGIDEGYPSYDYDNDGVRDCGDSDTWVVNSAADPGGGGCNSTECTLREAITSANSHPGLDNIVFNILPSGAHTIAPTSALPVNTGAAKIDGTTQPGFGGCTSATRLIELDGTSAGVAANGLHITAGNSLVRGLVINRFDGNGLVFETGGGNIVECNYIGTDTDGATAAGNSGSGVYVLNSADNDVGGMAAGAPNTIANNGVQGVRVEGEPSTGNTIRQNSIHSNADLGINTVDGGNDEILPPAIVEAGSDNFPGATGNAVSCTSGCVVEVFSDDVEEGRIFRGTAVTIGGNWVYGGTIPTGPNITATVTDPTSGNTSEFSAPYPCPNTDTDPFCDGHECDNDADGVCDVENQCGGDKNDPGRRPERIDNPFAPDLDEDNDGQVDEPLPPGTEPFDCDGDGYTGAREYGTPLCANNPSLSNTANDDAKSYPAYPGPIAADDALVNDGCPAIGAAETDCADTATTGLPLDDDSDGYNNDGCPQAGVLSEGAFNIDQTDQDPCGTDGWPSDFVSGGIPLSTNRVTITDLTSFVAPARRLDTAPGHPDFAMRWDLIPGPGLFNNWIAIDDLTALLAGPSGFPPMLNVARAFNHAGCPWPP